jgi:hypothetical protein
VDPHGLWFVKLATSALLQPRAATIVARVDKVASKQSIVGTGEVVVAELQRRLDSSNHRAIGRYLSSIRTPSIPIRGGKPLRAAGNA